MNDAEHAIITADPVLRRQEYAPMVRHYYECITAVYRQFWGDSYHFALFRDGESREAALVATEHMLADAGAFQKGFAVLDVGCGLGGPALNLAEYTGAEITGVDICEHHVQIARGRAEARGLAGQLRFVIGDGMQLPFSDEAFDRVYVIESGCHMPDKAAFVAECARVLRPGGEFLGLDWMQRDGLTFSEQERYVEPICRYCSLPDLISPSVMSGHLGRSGFETLISEQVSTITSLMRNWESASEASLFSTGAWDAKALERVSLGGAALRQGTSAGAFIIGHWHARKRGECSSCA